MDPLFIQAVVTAVLAAIGAGVRQWLKTTLTPKRINALLAQARIAIGAAEEVGRVLELDSPQKYLWAEDTLKALSKRLGLRLSPEELNGYIHALLYEEHVSEALAVGARPVADAA